MGEMATMTVVRLTIASIRRDGGTQTRAELSPLTVAEYVDAMEEGAKFPPVIVFHDGNDYWLADGFHRIAAEERIGYKETNAEVHQGTRRDAILYSAGANEQHGLRRTREDRRRAVMLLLSDPEWSQWSNCEIARRCNVSEGMIRLNRPKVEAVSSYNTKIDRKVERGGTTYTQDTTNIGKRRDAAGKDELTEAIESRVMEAPETESPTERQTRETQTETARQPAAKGKVARNDKIRQVVDDIWEILARPEYQISLSSIKMKLEVLKNLVSQLP